MTCGAAMEATRAQVLTGLGATHPAPATGLPRVFTFRFFHRARRYWREAVIVGIEEREATEAAWLVLARLEHQPDRVALRARWRIGTLCIEALAKQAEAARRTRGNPGS